MARLRWTWPGASPTIMEADDRRVLNDYFPFCGSPFFGKRDQGLWELSGPDSLRQADSGVNHVPVTWAVIELGGYGCLWCVAILLSPVRCSMERLLQTPGEKSE